MIARGIQGDLDFLGDAGGGLDRLHELEGLAIPRIFDRPVVGGIGARHGFGSVPEAVPAIAAPLVAAGLTHLRCEFLQDILFPDKAKTNDARPHVRSDDQFDFAVVQPDTVGPSSIAELLLELNLCHRRNHKNEHHDPCEYERVSEHASSCGKRMQLDNPRSGDPPRSASGHCIRRGIADE